MNTTPFLSKLTIAASLVMMSQPFNALADGTETLGNPSIAIQSGSGIVAAGTGLLTQPGTIDINVPGTVKQALLYWEGQSSSPALLDDSIVIDGTPVDGIQIGGPTLFFGSNYSATYRADITGLGLVSTGNNSLSVSGLDFNRANNGAGVLVIYDDGTSANIQLKDGNDLAYIGFAPPLNTTVPQTFFFAASASPRNASLPMFFSSVEGSASGSGADRPTAIEVTVNGVTTVYNNLLHSNDGEEWDTRTIPVIIPAGASSLTVQALSVDNEGIGNKPASFAWNAAGLAIEEVEVHGQGCTPGYWKQEHHFDSWTLPYTPATPFATVFDDAFPGKTLLDVLKQGGGGLKALGRHTVAALLNAASAGVDYDLTASDVIAQFNAAYPGSASTYEKLKNKFAKLNEQGCPLN
ncbi:MAG: hypothetical protein ACU841_02795 [Gammaproteobacteria bacterium]